MKKQMISLALAGAMAISLTACGSKTNSANVNAVSSDSLDVKIADWKDYDKLVEQVRKEADLTKRIELMHQAEDMLMDTGCIIPIYYYSDIYLVKDYVKGIYGTVEGMKYFYNAKMENGADELNVWIGSEPNHIDPTLNSTVDGGCLAVNTFEGLLRYNDKGELEPACAEKYEVSEDGLTYTFTLKDGLKWSNGDQLDATDFVYSWKRGADPKTAADYSYLCEVFAGYTPENGLASDDVVASEDGKTLTVKLKNVCPYFLDLCAFPFFFPVDEEVVEKNPEWAKDANKDFVTNGAFTLDSWKHDSSMTYKKNDNYWDADSVSVSAINYMLATDDTITYMAYNKGDLDYIESVPTGEVETALKSKDMVKCDNLGTCYSAFNIKSDLYNQLGLDEKQAVVFRKAISLLIDRQMICDTVVRTGVNTATSFIPESCSDGNAGKFKNKDYYGKDYDANVEEAKKLLESIGLYDTSTGQATKTIEFSYLISSGGTKFAEVIQNNLLAVGINLKIDQQEPAVFIDSRKSGKYDFAWNGWIMDYNDPINMLEMFTTNSGNNDCQFGR